MLNKLTESEEKFMKAVWDSGEEPTRANVERILFEEYNMDYSASTISTYIMKLKSKGYLNSATKGKYCRFQILVKEDEYIKEQLLWLIQYIYKNDLTRFVKDIKDLANEGKIYEY